MEFRHQLEKLGKLSGITSEEKGILYIFFFYSVLSYSMNNLKVCSYIAFI